MNDPMLQAERKQFEREMALRKWAGEPPLSFDGFGINGPDLYRRPLAKLTDYGKEMGVGAAFAAAPTMLAALEMVERELYSTNPFHDAMLVRVRAAIAEAKEFA